MSDKRKTEKQSTKLGQGGGNQRKGKLAMLAGWRAASDSGLQGSLAAEILWLYYCSTGRAGLVLGWQ